MTSFTRKLYNKDPLAAEVYCRQSKFERARQREAQGLLHYGRHTTLATFSIHALDDLDRSGRLCAASCGDARCRTGCKLLGD